MIFGMTYDFYHIGGKINACSNTSECHSYFESLKNKSNTIYVCFDDNDQTVDCKFNQTTNDNTTYVSFCVSFSSSMNPHKDFQPDINEDTIQADNFLNSINIQCENRRKYNDDIFCIF